MGRFSNGHYELGIEGLSLLRAGAARRSEDLDRRVGEIRAILADLDEEPWSEPRSLAESSVDEGYAGWAATYDDPGNDLIEIEEPIVRSMLAELEPGTALDAGCGTGRHAAHLTDLGHAVIGVDASAEMLARARSGLPEADFREGTIERLPLADGEAEAAVCALALSHLPELGPAIAELGRVIRPGGRLIISNPHPLATGVLGWRAVYVDPGGLQRMIPEYPHTHADYVEAFVRAGFDVRVLIEPGLSAQQARGRARHGHEDAFERALSGLPAAIVWGVERSR